MKKLMMIQILIATLAVLTGCVGTVIKSPTGFSAYRLAILWPTETGGFEVSTNGVLKVDGYKTDGGSAAMSQVSEGITKGVIDAMGKK